MPSLGGAVDDADEVVRVLVPGHSDMPDDTLVAKPDHGAQRSTSDRIFRVVLTDDLVELEEVDVIEAEPPSDSVTCRITPS